MACEAYKYWKYLKDILASGSFLSIRIASKYMKKSPMFILLRWNQTRTVFSWLLHHQLMFNHCRTDPDTFMDSLTIVVLQNQD